MSAKFTNAEINVALRAALDAKGEDYVYDKGQHGSCDYSRDGAPSCILGFVAHALDPEMFEAIANFENDCEMDGGEKSFGAVVSKLRLPFNPYQAEALQRVQVMQDNGEPWGDAVATEWIAALGERL